MDFPLSMQCGKKKKNEGLKVRIEQSATNMQFSVVCSGVVWSDMMLTSDDLLFMCSVTKQKY